MPTYCPHTKAKGAINEINKLLLCDKKNCANKLLSLNLKTSNVVFGSRLQARGRGTLTQLWPIFNMPLKQYGHETSYIQSSKDKIEQQIFIDILLRNAKVIKIPWLSLFLRSTLTLILKKHSESFVNVTRYDFYTKTCCES